MEKLIKEILEFRDKRNWEQFHTPKNLSISIALEASELLENFQWTQEALDLDNVKEEVADIYIYLLLLCEHYNLDINKIAKDKLKLNEKKYPVEKAYNNSKKHNKL